MRKLGRHYALNLTRLTTLTHCIVYKVHFVALGEGE